MNVKSDFLYSFGKAVFPRRIFSVDLRERFEKTYKILYFDSFDYSFISYVFFLSLLAGMFVYAFFFNFIQSSYYEYFVGFFLFLSNVFLIFCFSSVLFFCFVLFWFFRIEIIYKRKELSIERVLPLYLENLTSNLKGNIPISEAFVNSIIKDNKDLEEEILLLNQRIMLGEDVRSALEIFRKRFDSPVINRTFFLIEEGIEGGSNLPDSVEKISQNLININNIVEEYKANTRGFVYTIIIIAVVLAPLLFGISIVLLSFISQLFSMMSQDTSSQLTFGSVIEPIPDSFVVYLKLFSVAVLGVIGFFSSLIITQLKNERVFYFLKYMPIFLILSFIIYLMSSDFLLGFFNQLI